MLVDSVSQDPKGLLGISLDPGTMLQGALIAATAGLSQQARPIMIIVSGGGGAGLLGAIGINLPQFHWFTPKPEDISYSTPTRATMIQTFGGAYVDDFGVGVTEINFSGTSVYKGSLTSLQSGVLNVLGLGGFGGGADSQMWNLWKMIMQKYHADRQAKAEAGEDPNTVKMILIDSLNTTSWLVYPQSFTLRRSKSRPLIYQYNARFFGLEKIL